jgi:hypothetical protein
MSEYGGNFEFLATNPTTGVSKKVTGAKVANTNFLVPPSIVSNGTNYFARKQILEAPSPFYLNDTAYGYDGAWIKTSGSIVALGYDTDPTSITCNGIVGIDGDIYSLPSTLTVLDMPDLEVITGQFSILGYHPLATFNAPKLKYVGGDLTLYNLAGTSFSFPSLVACGGFKPNNAAAMLSISAPLLEETFGSFDCTGVSNLVTLDTPLIRTVGGNFSVGGAMTSLNFQRLQYVARSVTLSNIPNVTSVNLPALVRVGGTDSNAGITVVGSSNLTSFNIGSTLKSVKYNVSITGAALDQTSVDNILVRLAALDGTNGTTSYDSKTVTITGTSATPGAAGLAAKATLVARGCTVTTN